MMIWFRLGCYSRLWGIEILVLAALLLVVTPAVWASQPLVSQPLVKVGEVQRLPLLQTRAQPANQATEMLYLGMWQERFFGYARSNNWLTLSSQQQDSIRWDLLPGGEAVYTADNQQVYARGFMVHAYFVNDRLTGLRLSRNPTEPGFTLRKLHTLTRAWFPDNQILLHYQVLPQDVTQQVIHAYLGEVPLAFNTDLVQLSVPFCQSFLVPSNPLSLPLPNPPEHCRELQQLARSEGWFAAQ